MIGTLWKKARYAAAEVLFLLGGFVEPKEKIDFVALVKMATASKPTSTWDALADSMARLDADSNARAEKARRN
jgi:hypothetical protein